MSRRPASSGGLDVEHLGTVLEVEDPPDSVGRWILGGNFILSAGQPEPRPRVPVGGLDLEKPLRRPGSKDRRSPDGLRRDRRASLSPWPGHGGRVGTPIVFGLEHYLLAGAPQVAVASLAAGSYLPTSRRGRPARYRECRRHRLATSAGRSHSGRSHPLTAEDYFFEDLAKPRIWGSLRGRRPAFDGPLGRVWFKPDCAWAQTFFRSGCRQTRLFCSCYVLIQG